jgi:hypothetical protein
MATVELDEKQLRLYAAAPELLRICKELLSLWWNAQSKCSDEKCITCKRNLEKKRQFEAAIAKAENEGQVT